MKQIEKFDKVKFLGLLNDSPVLWYTDHVKIEGLSIPILDNADLGNMYGLVYGKIGEKEFVFQNGEFIEWPQTRYKDRIYGRLYDSQEYDGENYRLSYEYNGKEFHFETKTDERYFLKVFFPNKSEDVMMFTSDREKKYLFYSKTGEFLWQYTEEAEDLKINWRCIPVVDDVVVIISEDCGVMGKVQGFNIHTGERLWILNRREQICSNTFFIGEDKMLYGCIALYVDDIAELNLCKINPFTGELEMTVVLEDKDMDVCSWLVTMHGRRLYYTDNREGKEIGVIDVDKKVIVDRQPLEIKKNVTIGAPVVSDDRVYVYIRDLKELRVYDDVKDGWNAFDSISRAEHTSINKSSITKKVEETSNICDGHKCENKELKDVKKENITQLITDVNGFIINGFYGLDKYCVLINGEEIKIDVNQRSSFNNVDSFYEYSSAIVIKGEEIDKYDDATYGYLGYHDVYPGYMDISSYKNEEYVLSQIPQTEQKEILVGDAHDGYKTVRLIPKRYIEKMVIRKRSLDWDSFVKNQKIRHLGKSRVIAELNMQVIEKEILDSFKEFYLINTYEDLSVLLNDKYVSSFISRHQLACHMCRNALLMTYRERYVFIFYQMEKSERSTFFCYDKQTEKFMRLSDYGKEEIVYGKDVSVDYPKGRFSVLYRQIALLDKYLSDNPDFEMSKFSDCFITNEEMKTMYEL